MNKERSASYYGGDNFRLAQQMSVMVKDGEVPDFDRVVYALSQQPSEPVPYDERRGT